MNLEKMLEAQKELDLEICKKANIKRASYIDLKMALCSELSELANEWGGFKYWKLSHRITDNTLLEEWADCMHIALTLFNMSTVGIKKQDLEFIENSTIYDHITKNRNAITSVFLECYRKIATGEKRVPRATAIALIINIIKIGKMLGYTEEELEKAYYNKRYINIKRVKEGY